jgi:TDG/mug DNA glycosylase family protein
MTILPDILSPNLDVVFCGTAVGNTSAERGHYYAGRGNMFWRYLHLSGLTSEQLQPEDDVRLPSFGIGLTDLVKDIAQSHDRGLDFSDAPDLQQRLEPHQPAWVAFTGLTAAAKAARVFGRPKPRHGVQNWRVGDARVFVVSNPSGANASGPWDGRTEKIEWWHELAAQVRLLAR